MIYAIRAGDEGPIKIGRARKPKTRLRELQVGSALPLRIVAESDWHDENESILHDCLRDSSLRGEWFEPTESVLTAVALIRSGDLDGLEALAGRAFRAQPFDKVAYQREYMRKRRATVADRTPNRRSRADYNAYQREYMRVWNAVKAGRACWWPKR